MSNNINWLDQDEALVRIKNLIELNENTISNCETEMSKFKSKFNTDNKYEACDYQHWNTMKWILEKQTKELKEIIEFITDIKYEELEQFKEAEEQDRDNRYSSYIGG